MIFKQSQKLSRDSAYVRYRQGLHGHRDVKGTMERACPDRSPFAW